MNIEKKIISTPQELKEICQNLKEHYKVVLTTGAFDILHDGHLRYLINSKKLGTRLVVGINSDKSIKRIKGKSRPILPEKIRAFMIAGFECVDYVFIFDNDETITDLVRPNILVMSKTSENQPEDRQGQLDILYQHSGRLVLLESQGNMNTSTIIKKIRSS